MQVILDIPKYSSERGIEMQWESNFEIIVRNNGGEILLKANKEGLLSLAKQLLVLAQPEIPIGYHIHYDEHNSLEEGSSDLIIEKM